MPERSKVVATSWDNMCITAKTAAANEVYNALSRKQRRNFELLQQL